MDSFPQSKCFLFYDVKYSSREMSSRMCNPRHCIMDSSALVCPGGGYGYIANFVASFCSCGLAAKSIGFAILNPQSEDSNWIHSLPLLQLLRWVIRGVPLKLLSALP